MRMMQTQSFILLSFLTFAFGCDENAGSKCENDHNAAVANQTAGNKVYCAALLSFGTCLSTAGNCSTSARFKDAWAAAEKGGVSCSRNCKDLKADECESKFQSGIKAGNGSTAPQAGTTAYCIVFANYTDCMTSAGNCQLDSKYKTSYDDRRDNARCDRTCKDDVGRKCYETYSTATTGKEAGSKDFCDAVKTYLSCMDTSECALDPKFSPTVNQTVANAAKCAVKAPTASPTSSAPTANATASPTNAITASPTANGTAAPANGTAAPAPSNSSASPTSTPTPTNATTKAPDAGSTNATTKAPDAGSTNATTKAPTDATNATFAPTFAPTTEDCMTYTKADKDTKLCCKKERCSGEAECQSHADNIATSNASGVVTFDGVTGNLSKLGDLTCSQNIKDVTITKTTLSVLPNNMFEGTKLTRVTIQGNTKLTKLTDKLRRRRAEHTLFGDVSATLESVTITDNPVLSELPRQLFGDAKKFQNLKSMRLYGNNFTTKHDCCGAANDTKCKKDLEANKTSTKTSCQSEIVELLEVAVTPSPTIAPTTAAPVAAPVEEDKGLSGGAIVVIIISVILVIVIGIAVFMVMQKRKQHAASTGQGGIDL